MLQQIYRQRLQTLLQIRVRPSKLHLVSLATAVIGCIVFFLPLLGALQPTSSGWPGFMMSGDIEKFYLPSFVEGYRRFWHGGLFGIDFLTDDGASVFAYRANLMPFYPPYLLSYLLFDVSKVPTAVAVYCVIHVLHMAAALYSSVLLGRRFLRLGLYASVLFAFLFCLSYQAAAYIAFATFYFQMMLVPIAAYGLSRLMLSRSRMAPLLWSPVFVNLFLTSYGPTMGGALATAVILAGYIFWTRIKPRCPRGAWRLLIAPGTSLGVAALVVLPYYLAQRQYVSEVAPSHLTVQAVAQELAFSGRDIINAFSQFLMVGTSVTEGRFIWGMIPAMLIILGLVAITLRRRDLSASLLNLWTFSAAMYLAYLSVTLGRSLSVADMFYYAVPVLGHMHIFQRYLLFGQIFFAAAAASGAQLYLKAASPTWHAVCLTVALVAWLGLSVFFNVDPAAATVVDLGPLLAELFVCFVAAVTLCTQQTSIALVAVAALSGAVSVQTMYSMQSNLGRPAMWDTELEPLGQSERAFAAFLKANSSKSLSKVLYLTPGPGSFLYRNYPWLVGSDLKIMSFQGYEPHLSMVRDYWFLMGGRYGEFNREWVMRTGLDFVVWDQATAGKVADLQTTFGPGISLGPTFSAGPALSAAKILYDTPTSIGDAGPIVSMPQSDPAHWPPVAISDGWVIQDGGLARTPGKVNNLHIAASVDPGVTYELSFRATGNAGLITTALGGYGGTPIAITGDGAYSITLKPVATGDLWLGATDDFQGSLTDVTLREASAREVTLRPVDPLPIAFDNGILRLEAEPTGTVVDSAKTNYATRVTADVTVSGNARLAYLLWPISYMAPYLDGRRTEWVKDGNWPAYIPLTPGHHRFELRFESAWGLAFKGSSLAYAIILVFGVFLALWRVFLRRSQTGVGNFSPVSLLTNRSPIPDLPNRL